MINSKNKSFDLRKFSWSKNKNITNTQKLLESTVLEWYDAKHRRPTIQEINFLNNLGIKDCPKCGSNEISKNGFTDTGMQRFICRHCGKRFNILTSTIFDSKKIPISEWIEYLLHLFEFHSVKTSSFDNRNADSTGRYWLKKVFLVLKNIQNDVVLSNRVYIDETFFTVQKSKIVTKNGKKLRGISRNKICVVTGTDAHKSFFIAIDISKLNETAALATYGHHIKPESLIVHDLELSHNILIDRLKLQSAAYDSNDLKNISDKENPMEPINRLHALLKKFMGEHGGYNRDDLQDWLNLFWFIVNGPENKYDKVLLFIERAVKIQKKLRYRQFFKRKN